MYRLMIADDEESIRNGIARGIAWQQLGYEVCALCADGREVLNRMEECRPDVVLSDIRMPGMDGVELMQRLRQDYPAVKIVILSGYSDFEYLNMSIKSHVTEYLLKPTDFDEFEEVFRRLKATLDHERLRNAEIHESVQRHFQVWLSALLLGAAPQRDTRRFLPMLTETGIDADNLVAVVFTLDGHGGDEKTDLLKLWHRVIEIGESLDAGGLHRLLFLHKEETMVGFYSSSSELEPERVVQDIRALQDAVRRQAHATLSAGVSDPCTELDMLPQAYEQANCCARQNVFSGRESIYLFSQLGKDRPENLAYFDTDCIEKAIMRQDYETIRMELDRVFATFGAPMREYLYADRLCLSLLFHISLWGLRYGVFMSDVMRTLGAAYTDIYHCDTLANKRSFVLAILFGYQRALADRRSQGHAANSVAMRVREYVDAEFCSNTISLEQVAAFVHKTPAYVSRVFKNELECNFSDYLTEKRMRYAAGLLRDPDCRVYEIAERCGYADASGFIRVFKKFYGISPADYRAVRGMENEQQTIQPATSDVSGVGRLFLPMLAAITLLFRAALRTQQRAEAEALCYTAQDISKTLDRYVEGVYSVSDAFATDERLLEVLDRDYREDPVARQYAILHTNGAVFESYARLVQQKKIDAVYVVNRRDVLNFLDLNQETSLVLSELIRLNVNDRDKLGKFCFYPLMDNFLTTSSYDEPRRDHVVLGSRRVYSALKSGYPYVHIFAIEEQMLYELYELQARHQNAQVYILDEDGQLISSTDAQAVAACAMPGQIARINAELTGEYALVPLDGQRYSAARSACASTGWSVLVLTPGQAWLPVTSSLYLKILAVILVCLGVFAVLIVSLYRRFMAPLAQLEQAMHRADTGDLHAYVKPQGTAEMVRMMEGYNAMLDGIRVGMEQRMQLERHRQELEMQVLMNQINPHFLYNTLETIVWKASEAGRSDIGKMASSLGRLYRLSIADGMFVPLQQELEHVRMYMNIQQSRYSNRVAYDVRLHGCDAARLQVLKLILQPVVENCFLHGMEGLERTLCIRVSARRRGEQLILTVTDNGVGMKAAALEALRSQIVHGKTEPVRANRRSTGIGLHNIYARLQLYAGASSDVQAWSLPGVGTQISLLLPWNSPKEGGDAARGDGRPPC